MLINKRLFVLLLNIYNNQLINNDNYNIDNYNNDNNNNVLCYIHMFQVIDLIC